MKFLLGIAQIKPTLGNLDANLAMVEEAVAQAKKRRVDLLVFPELGLTGYFLKDMVPGVALMKGSSGFRRLLEMSKGLALLIGFVEESRSHIFYNAAAFMDEGRLAHIHRKVYLPTYGIFDEQRYVGRGRSIRAFDTRFGRAAVLICEDAWHPSAAYVAAQDGADLLFIPSASPGRGVKGRRRKLAITETWEDINRSYARLFSQFVIFANRVGFEDGINFWGGSEVISPTGECLARGRLFEPDFLTATIDMGEVRRSRISTPTRRDEDLGLTLRELRRVERAHNSSTS